MSKVIICDSSLLITKGFCILSPITKKKDLKFLQNRITRLETCFTFSTKKQTTSSYSLFYNTQTFFLIIQII